MRFFIEGCLEIGLVVLISYKKTNGDRLGTSTWFRAGFGLTILFTLGLALAPIYLVWANREFRRSIKEGNPVIFSRYAELFSTYRKQS